MLEWIRKILRVLVIVELFLTALFGISLSMLMLSNFNSFDEHTTAIVFFMLMGATIFIVSSAALFFMIDNIFYENLQKEEHCNRRKATDSVMVVDNSNDAPPDTFAPRQKVLVRLSNNGPIGSSLRFTRDLDVGHDLDFESDIDPDTEPLR